MHATDDRNSTASERFMAKVKAGVILDCAKPKRQLKIAKMTNANIITVAKRKRKRKQGRKEKKRKEKKEEEREGIGEVEQGRTRYRCGICSGGKERREGSMRRSRLALLRYLPAHAFPFFPSSLVSGPLCLLSLSVFLKIKSLLFLNLFYGLRNMTVEKWNR
jgi:hypothetical protein